MYKKISCLLGTLIFAGVIGCGSANEAPAQVEESAVSTEENEYMQGKYYVQIEVENYGDIIVELDADTAPITVTNFMELVNNHFYDGLTFHRIISGFMIQGGDPEGTGMGGSDKKIKGEFKSNGVENDIHHERGVISMARSRDKNSASSQFFIMHDEASYLDGDYAGFGHVISGIEVVDAICDNTPVQDRNGTVLRDDQPVITKMSDVSEKYK